MKEKKLAFTFAEVLITLGIVGIIGVSINYPIYKKILQNGKNKYSYDIITLAKEIVNE